MNSFNKIIAVVSASLVALAAVFTTSCSNNTESNLTCNYKVADITPKDSVILAGFAARKGLYTQTVGEPLPCYKKR